MMEKWLTENVDDRQGDQKVKLWNYRQIDDVRNNCYDSAQSRKDCKREAIGDLRVVFWN